MDKKTNLIYRNARNNAQGRIFENEIERACKHYKEFNLANIEKTPEPFRVIEKNYKNATFKGRFTGHAQPDFKGTVAGGRSIVFEVKYTLTDTIKSSILTKQQQESLESHYKHKAIAGVCVGIKDNYFFVPWKIWRDMKLYIGKKSANIKDLKEFKINYKFRYGIDFLEFINKDYTRYENND